MIVVAFTTASDKVAVAKPFTFIAVRVRVLPIAPVTVVPLPPTKFNTLVPALATAVESIAPVTTCAPPVLSNTNVEL